MSRHWLAVVALLATATAWGATFTLVKNVLARIAPEPFIFYRFTLAGIILLLVAARRGGVDRTVLRPGLVLGLLVFGGYWLQTHGLLTISSPRSAFLTSLYVVMVPFCDALVYRTPVPLRAWSASGLALAGTAMLVGGVDARIAAGDLMTLACAATFAFHVILSARWSARHSAMALAAIQVLTVGAVAAPASAFAARPQMTPAVIGAIVFTAVVTTAIAFTALMWAQAHVTATEAAVILAFEPVAAAITAVVWDSEPMTATFLAGGAIILAAMVVSQLPKRAAV